MLSQRGGEAVLSSGPPFTNFSLGWSSYKSGFGSLHGEFWLGNDAISELTSKRDMVLRVELEDFDGVKAVAEYDHFKYGKYEWV